MFVCMFRCLQTSSISQTGPRILTSVLYSSSDRVEPPTDHRVFHEFYEFRHASAGYTY